MIGLIAKLVGGAFAPLAFYGIIAAVGMAVVGGIWKSGYNYADRKCEAAALRQELANVRRDLAIEQERAAQAQKDADELQKQKGQADEHQRALEAELAKRPVSERCDLSEPDARRLR